MADLKITELNALAAGSQATGDLLTLVDVSEAAAVDKNKKMTFGDFFKGTPAIAIGTTVVGQSRADNLTVNNDASTTNNCGITIRCGTAGQGSVYFSDGESGDAELRGQVVYDHNGDYMQLSTNATERLRITSTGSVGIGIQNPSEGLQIAGQNSGSIRLTDTTGAVGDLSNVGWKFQQLAGNAANNASGLSISSDTTERVSISSAGLVGIGTSSPSAKFEILHNSSTAFDSSDDGAQRSGTASLSITNHDNSNNSFSQLVFDTANSNQSIARIAAIRTGNGSNEMAFVVEGSNTKREAMRIDSSGNLMVGKTVTGLGTTGHTFFASGRVNFTRNTGVVLNVNRLGNDGTLAAFYQDDSNEGTISVSGTTVSYNGAHLSRWSQLESGAARTEILRGSVLSNLDEMCEWGEEDNEQLNRMQVSDVEGDKNVSGVFQAWDDDDDTYVNDFYCAMTGDFVIRIAQGTTVARGDLLMSAGDGTAKPQDDDIVRSNTIAKVTSTTVSETYSDSSYCVPCVLMAC